MRKEDSVLACLGELERPGQSLFPSWNRAGDRTTRRAPADMAAQLKAQPPNFQICRSPLVILMVILCTELRCIFVQRSATIAHLVND